MTTIAAPAHQSETLRRRVEKLACGLSMARLHHRRVEIESKVVSGALHEIALDEIDACAPQCGRAARVFDARRDDLHAALVRGGDELAQLLAHGVIGDAHV